MILLIFLESTMEYYFHAYYSLLVTYMVTMQHIVSFKANPWNGVMVLYVFWKLVLCHEPW
jgi:hypothetical protein